VSLLYSEIRKNTREKKRGPSLGAPLGM